MVQGDFRPIATIYTSPGWTSERIYLFLGIVDHNDRSSAGGGLPSEGEDIRVDSSQGLSWTNSGINDDDCPG